MIDEPMETAKSTPPAEDEDTIGWTVPWFFQDDEEPGLRAQVGWTGRHLGLSDEFYARFLRVPEATFRDWRLGRGELPGDRQDVLRDFWYTVRYLLGFTSRDPAETKAFLERVIRVENTEFWTSPYTPPWNGTCLKSYLEDGGPGVLRDVDAYLTRDADGDYD